MTHQYPPIPPCPDCGATASKCLRPSGHEAMHWHVARETAYARICRCREVCLPWLLDHAPEEVHEPTPTPSALHQLDLAL